jgi:hypothetical protein
LKENASPEELQKAKDKAKSDGGEIKHEFTLIKGFTSVQAVVWYGRLLTCTIELSSPKTKLESFRRTSTSTSSKMAKSRLNKRSYAGVGVGEEL